jgi:glutamate 5-kinase
MSRLAGYRRIAIKIGSSLLIAPPGGLNNEWLDSVCADIAAIRGSGTEVMVVTSGAIALGRKLLALPPGPLKLEDSQAAAACGQISLAGAWSGALGRLAMTAGQILLTLDDTKGRRRYLNARATIDTLLRLQAVPVINENDTIATTEIRYGDNDRLAAHVATMMGADLLILLSDVDGLYSGPPALDPDARFIEHVAAITPEIEAMAGAAGTELSRGGMVTKIEAGRIVTAAGTEMVITSGKKLHPVAALDAGARATWFAASGNWVTARKKWISGQIGVKGALFVDDGALRALANGKSLLPAGIRRAEGDFRRGDVISVCAEDGSEIGRGIVAYDIGDARRILGRKSAQIAEILGYAGRTEMIHRDDLVMHRNATERRTEQVTTGHA